jgi:uncharacterized protein (DUF1800 family)
MAALEIKEVVPDYEHDPAGSTFILRFKRTLTYFELATVPMVISSRFSPTEVSGPAEVTIRQAHIAFFTDPQIRERLKGMVAEAEKLADEMLDEEHRAVTEATAKQEDVRRTAAEIDWDSKPEGGQ